MYLSYLQGQPTANAPLLVGHIKDYLQIVNPTQGEKVYAFFPEMTVRGDGSFDIPLRTTEGVQNILFESPSANPVTLTLVVRPHEGKIEVSAQSFGDKAQVLDLEGKIARLREPIAMSRTRTTIIATSGVASGSGSAAALSIPAQPSPLPRVSPEFESVALPQPNKGPQ